MPSENPGASTIPTIVISQQDCPAEAPERAETEQEPGSAGENCTQDKKEDSDNPLTSHIKMIFKGLRRSKSQESLVSTKNADDEDPPYSDAVPHCSQNGGVLGESTEGPSWRHFHTRSSKPEKVTFRLSSGANKGKGKDQGTLPRAEDSHCQKSQVNWEQLEATKAIFDLLKEISGLCTTLGASGLRECSCKFVSSNQKSHIPHRQNPKANCSCINELFLDITLCFSSPGSWSCSSCRDLTLACRSYLKYWLF